MARTHFNSQQDTHSQSESPPTPSHRQRQNQIPSPSLEPEPTYDVPFMFQTNPSLTCRYRPKSHTSRSATDSIESRSNWAFYQASILDELHKIYRPNYEGVIKCLRPVNVSDLTSFQMGVRRRLSYFSKKYMEEFAVFYVIEGERNNCVHYHLLIRTSVCCPDKVLEQIVTKSSNGIAELKHCEAISDVERITHYTVKDIAAAQTGEKEVLLFKRGLGLRICGSWNKYFTVPKADLWAKCKASRYGSSTEPQLDSH